MASQGTDRAVSRAQGEPAPAAKSAGCCPPVEQATCCEPAAKGSCCGDAKAKSCGCR